MNHRSRVLGIGMSVPTRVVTNHELATMMETSPGHREASYATVESAVLREMIERTMFWICDDETGFTATACFSRAAARSAGWCRPTDTD